MKLLMILGFTFFLAGQVMPQIKEEPDSASETKSFCFKPVIGLGTGMFTFYGDISAPHKVNQPLVSRIGYDLSVSQEITNWFDLGFYVFFGMLGANERSLDRNLNFESHITTGGMEFIYNFNNLLKPGHIIEPYIAAGIESCEFLSKTDVVDANGNNYYYWSDGSIRNIDENDPNAENATRLVRDYTYESDIREMNIDGFGKYPERTWAVPVGTGASLHLNKHWSFRIGTAMHFTFTDYIDGITEESVGKRAGDASNDRFLMSSFSLHYHFFTGDKKDDRADADLYADVDFLALDMADEDADGVSDFDDNCPNTPPGAPVNDAGCPTDEDADGVPDYLDLEPGTPDTAVVDEAGRALSDSLIEDTYLRFIDSTGMFARITHKIDANEVERKKTSHKYFIKMGTYSEEISPSVADIYLSMADVQTTERDNATYFEISEQSELAESIRQEEVTPSKVEDVKTESFSDGTVIFRVQLGAFSRKLSKNTFSGLSDILEVPSNDGITRYYTGSFTSMEEANKQKNKAERKGFRGAFIVPFRNGKRISLSDAGMVQQTTSNPVKEEHKTEAEQQDNYGMVRFKVQVAACSGPVRQSELNKFRKFGQVETKNVNGLTKCLLGSFPDYSSAQSLRSKIESAGVKGAFVVGEYRGKLMPASEAMKMLK
ncbi:MAG: SPOR domain-containing protein [Flavobacteriales bacterium]